MTASKFHFFMNVSIFFNISALSSLLDCVVGEKSLNQKDMTYFSLMSSKRLKLILKAAIHQSSL
jgi:hypothetical protein